MKALFIVTSAIRSGNGSHEERLFQTLHTIDSIRSRFSQAEVWLCDSSVNSIYELPKHLLILLKGIRIIDFSNHFRISEILSQVKTFDLPTREDARLFFENGLIKNLTESYVFNQILDKVDRNNYDRVFKLSGRYFLTEEFNVNVHDVYGKMVMTPKIKSWEPNLLGTDFHRECICWSCCTSKLDTLAQSFHLIEEYIIRHSNTYRLADIEHGLNKYVPEKDIYTVEVMGVAGRTNNEYQKFI